MIAFNLLGIKTMAQDKNQPTLLEYANDAQKLAKSCLFQRDVTVELYSMDKRGTFFGTILMPNKTDFAVKLLEEGLAQIYQPGNAKKPTFFDQYKAAEDRAKSKEIGIWGSSLKLMSTGQG